MLDRDDLDYLARRRWRRGAQAVDPARIGFLTLLLVLHLGVLLTVRANSLRARPPAPRHDDVLSVRLLPPEQPDLPVTDLAAPQARSSVAAAPRARSGEPVQAESVTAVPAPADGAYLFNPDGSLKLPEGVPEPGSTAFRNPEPEALPAPRNPLPYKPTHFEPYWVPDHETLGARLVRQTTVVKTIDTKYGTRIQCTWSLFMPVMAGCGWGLTPREPTKPAPWLAVAGETRPETPIPFDPDPFD